MASEDNGKVLDIKTGQAPESTSRPVIVSNRAMVKDPTVKDDDEKPVKKQDEKLVKSEAKPLRPVSEELQKEEAKQTDEASADEDAKTPAADQKPEAELSAAEKARQEEVAKLIADGKYVVPVGHIERNQRVRKMLPFIVLLVLLVIVAAWFSARSRLLK